MDCNALQNERGGKDLLLKICQDFEFDVAVGTADNPTHMIVSQAHGAEVGDLVEFSADELGTRTDVNAGRLYIVKTVVNTTTLIISDTITPGTAVTFTAAVSDMEFKIYKGVGGLRAHTFAFASDAIDASNYGTNQFRKIIDGAGMRQISLSGDGVFSGSDIYNYLETKAFANLLVCMAFVDARVGKVIYGCFKITALESSASFDGEATFTLSAQSSGEYNVYTLVADV